MGLTNGKEWSPKVDDAKLKAAGWEEVAIGLWKKEDSCFNLDTNAIVGVVYHFSYMGFDGWLECFDDADSMLTWIEANEAKYQERYGSR